MKNIVIVILLFLFNVDVMAADRSGKFQVYGVGYDSCGKFIVVISKSQKGKKNKSLVPYSIWLEGYMSAFNALSENTFSLDTKADDTDRMAFIEKYCREKPLDGYFKAVLALMDELYPRRIELAPQEEK